MQPPEADGNHQANVVYNNKNSFNQDGIWQQYHTAKTRKMHATDTPGDSAFKTSGASSPTSLVKFDIKSEYNGSVFNPHATGSLLYSHGRIKGSMQGYVKPTLTGSFIHKQTTNAYKVAKDGTLRFEHPQQSSKFASNSNLPKFQPMPSNYSKSNKNRPNLSQNWKSGSGGYCMNSQGYTHDGRSNTYKHSPQQSIEDEGIVQIKSLLPGKYKG